MIRKLSLLVAGLSAAAGLFYVARTHPPSSTPSSTQTAIGGFNAPALRTVCVQPVQNLAKRPLDMAGLDEALVYQLKRAKVQAGITPSTPDGQAACDAFIYTEITEVAGKGRSHAELEFRVVMKDETPPRLSATAKGKSAAKLPSIEKSGFMPSSQPVIAPAAPAPGTGPEHDAIIAAFEDQASQIAAAQRWGFPPQAASTK
jgi:hypothetical protein